MIDTHCHLLDGSFDEDRKKVIERAISCGVTEIIEISCEPVLWQRSLFLCENYKDIFCAIGVHPNDSDKFVNFTDFSGFLTNEKVVAVGECGLDYYRNRVDKKTQIAVFEKQLAIAENFKKPVIIHCRQAEEDVYKILDGHKNIKGVIHCFSSSVEFAEKFLQLGFYIGIDGPVTYPNAKVLREVVKMLPVEKMLLETDSPYLPPQNFRGKRNEPSYIKFIAEKIAEIKEMPVSEISKITDENAKKLFGI
ncbi:MAG: TatD family hydrolase [Elusimicrobiota bacterium]